MLTWQDVINDKSLQDLPYKIELNRYGKVEMSPASNRHVIVQGELQHLIKMRLPGGVTIPECSVQTSAGVKVPDVAWCSYRFFEAQGTQTPFPVAPEICVEVVSPSNSEAELRSNTEHYLALGAIEVWLVSEGGAVEVHTTTGVQDNSTFGFDPAAELSS